MEEFTGNDVLTDDEQVEVSRQDEWLTAKLEAAIQASTDTKQWLNTPLGKSLRETIKVNKLAAMHIAAASQKDAEVEQARQDYATWNAVEQVFATIISGGEEALKQLQLAETNYAQVD